MVINNSSTNVSIYPLIPFNGNDVEIYVTHKQTRIQVTDIVSVTVVGQNVVVPLPSLTSIADVAEDMDEIVIRITQTDQLLYEYVGYWITGSVSQYRNWKTWDTTDENNHDWVTI